MKNQETKKAYSHGQRILAWGALIGIFVCGVMAGAFIWQKHANTAVSGVDNNFANKYLSPCEMREHALLANVATDINNANVSQALYLHRENAKIYDKLSLAGCHENMARYKELANAELAVADVLKDFDQKERYVYYSDFDIIDLKESEPCEVIERTLHEGIRTCREPYCHLRNAEIYSKMAEDGCPENKEANTQRALDELQIAEGVRMDDTDIQGHEIRSAVNTYKKLQMINEAYKYLNKVEKLVNPGVEFIMELQRIIEE